MKKAFSLLELLISVAILFVIASFLLINPERAPRTYEFLNATHRMGSIIQKTQGYAIATQDFKGSPPSGGWGIHIENGKRCYIVFADVNASRNYNPAASESPDICDSGLDHPSSERFERSFLESSVEVLDLLVNGVSVSAVDIIYLPPHPDVLVNGSSQSATIVLRSKTLGTTKTITANTVGNVNVQ